MDIEQSPSIAGLCAALVAAQSELRNPLKDSVNPFFKSRYADLATVRDTVVPTLAAHGLAVIQMPSTLNGQPALTSTLCHKSGEWIRSTMLLYPAKSDPQGIGSALTYARRYALQSITGVAAEEDDDGNAASHPTNRLGGRIPLIGSPKPKPAQPPAARPSDAHMKELMTAKGWSWAAVVNEINRQENENYLPTAKPDQIRPESLRDFFAWLATQPKAAKAAA
jgi:hypothetical protein